VEHGEGAVLTRLLDLVREGGTHRVTDLARQLGATTGLVEAMLESLERMGYLKQVGDGCAGRCNSCPLAGMCAVGAPTDRPGAGSGRVWTLAEE